ncbi:MAG: tetratricopeptide repeat protein, partial [Bacteroidales bacterium]|nr:tetratricopeptide repeat protein [Bacteroidales bacterium]
MKRLFLLFFLALLCNVAFSQIADSLKYADSISNVGLSLFKLGDYNSALPYFEEAILIQKEKSGENNIDYTKTLNRLACTYESLGDYNKALDLFLRLMA